MIEIDEFPGQVTGLPVRALVGEGLLSPRLARMQAFFDRLASRSAREEAIPEDIQANAGLYALWGRTSDGEVLGLRRVGGVWRMMQVPIPSGVVRSLNLPGVLEAREELVWVEIGPDRIHLLRQGERVPIFQAEVPDSPQPAPRTPRGPKPPGLALS
jgi:hypothetical protein